MKKYRAAQLAGASMIAGGAAVLLSLPVSFSAVASATADEHIVTASAVPSPATASPTTPVPTPTHTAAPVPHVLSHLVASPHLVAKSVKEMPRTSNEPRNLTPVTSPAPAASFQFAGSTGPTSKYTTIKIGAWAKRVAPGGQSLVNSCTVAVLWAGPMPGVGSTGTSVVVGHNYCGGFSQFAKLRVGTIVTVTSPRGTQRYRVYAHNYVGRHGGSAMGLFRGDLTLQSCLGSGTGFSYAKKI